MIGALLGCGVVVGGAGVVLGGAATPNVLLGK